MRGIIKQANMRLIINMLQEKYSRKLTSVAYSKRTCISTEEDRLSERTVSVPWTAIQRLSRPMLTT